MWLKSIPQDRKSYNHSPNEAPDTAQDRPLGRVMSGTACVSHYALLVVHAREEEMIEINLRRTSCGKILQCLAGPFQGSQLLINRLHLLNDLDSLGRTAYTSCQTPTQLLSAYNIRE